MVRAIFLVPMSVAVTGAGVALWSSASRTALTAHVCDVFPSSDVDPAILDCRMVRTTRSGMCLFDTSEMKIQNLIAAHEPRDLGFPTHCPRFSGQMLRLSHSLGIAVGVTSIGNGMAIGGGGKVPSELRRRY